MRKKLSDEQLEEMKAIYLGGDVTMAELADHYGVSVWTVRHHSKIGRWPTPQRISIARNRSDLPLTDPSRAAAVDWERRKREEREKAYNGSSKALEKFYKRPPTPKDWKEAKVAHDILEKALDPEKAAKDAAGVNIAILNGELNPFGR